ncbi:hypothetical protein HY086_00325 [Candidatus Gottesmanbacteria bacterium]|nr:hypothetical protein [Candidatus Gottesmanbacteria bacterium]
MAIISVRDTMFAAWRLFRIHWKLLVVVSLINLLLGLIYPAIKPILSGKDLVSQIGNAFAALVLYLLQALTYMGMLTISIKLANGQTATVSMVFGEYRKLIQYILLLFLLVACTLPAFLLLIIPGIYVGIRLQFAMYALVDKGSGPMAAVKESWAITKSSVKKLFMLDLIVASLSLLGALTFGVGMLVTIPLSLLALATVYRTLEAAQQ